MSGHKVLSFTIIFFACACATQPKEGAWIAYEYAFEPNDCLVDNNEEEFFIEIEDGNYDEDQELLLEKPGMFLFQPNSWVNPLKRGWFWSMNCHTDGDSFRCDELIDTAEDADDYVSIHATYTVDGSFTDSKTMPVTMSVDINCEGDGCNENPDWHSQPTTDEPQLPCTTTFSATFLLEN